MSAFEGVTVSYRKGSRTLLAEVVGREMYRYPDADVFLAIGPSRKPDEFSYLMGLPAGTPIMQATEKDTEQFAGYHGDHIVMFVAAHEEVPENVWRTMEGSMTHAPRADLILWDLTS